MGQFWQTPPWVSGREYSPTFVLIRQNKKGFSAWKQGRENEWDGNRNSQCLWVTGLELGKDEDAMPAVSNLQLQA